MKGKIMMTSCNTDYKKADRIVLFREVIVDKPSGEVNDQKLESILGDQYIDFVHLCEEIESDRDNIESLTSVMEDDKISFNLKRKKVS